MSAVMVVFGEARVRGGDKCPDGGRTARNQLRVQTQRLAYTNKKQPSVIWERRGNCTTAKDIDGRIWRAMEPLAVRIQ